MTGFDLDWDLHEVFLLHNGRVVFVADSDARIGDEMERLVEVLNTKTHSRIIRDWNGTDAPYWIG